MDSQQLEELEKYYKEQYHDYFEYAGAQNVKIEYNPNKMYFYYIFSNEHKLIHGDESAKGLYKELIDIYEQEDISQEDVKKIEWDSEHYLLLSKPIFYDDKVQGQIIVGKSITSEHHFLREMGFLFVVLIIVFTFIIALLSYYMAKKAMIPIQNSLEKQKKFVSDASHELRTPLSVFYSSLDILETDESDHFTPFGKELISDLKEEAELMKTLLEKLLFLARHDQNRLEIRKEPFSLSDLLNSIGVKFQRTLPDSLSLHLDIQEKIQMVGDSKKMNELVYILLENAVQYTPEGFIRLQLLKNDGKITVIVEDSGIGIAKEELPLIFDRFYRSDSARKRDGTGLGLSIADAIVKEHGGTIQVTSEVNKGTTFYIHIPSN